MDKNENCIVKGIIIPQEYRDELLKELSMLGINRAVMFADNPDIVCEEIKK